MRSYGKKKGNTPRLYDVTVILVGLRRKKTGERGRRRPLRKRKHSWINIEETVRRGSSFRKKEEEFPHRSLVRKGRV